MKTKMNQSSTIFPRWFLLVSGTLIAFIISFLFLQQAGYAQTATSSIKIDDNFNRRSIKYSNGIQNFEIEYQGNIEVTDDDKDIKSISPGGYLEISKTTFGSRRKIYIEAEGGGRLKKSYFEGRQDMPFEPEGRKWLAEILPEIVRSTRIAAQSRVNRYYKNGGVNGVLNEIENLKSDYVKIHYADLLLEKENLKSSDLVKITEHISEEVNSDYYLASLFKDKSKIFLSDPKASEAYFTGITNIKSDYYLAVVLKHALNESKPSSAAMEKLVKAIEHIGSDYYQTVVISTLLEDKDLSSEVLTSVINTTQNIQSDYYQSTVLKKALEHNNLSKDGFNILLNEVSNVSSDYYMATIFGDLLEEDLDIDMKIHIINTVSSKMSSDYYLATLLTKVFENGEVNEKLAEATLEAVSNINSDHYASTVIAKAARKQSNLDKKSLITLIKATETISSDYYQMAALVELADAVNRLGDNEVKDAYRDAAKNIGSDTYYGKALKALD